MSDRELLEWAAKAYWHGEIDDVMSFRWDEQEQTIVYTHADNQDHNGNDVELLWLPLTDDGDALRLAVTLRLTVVIEDHEVEVYCYSHSSDCLVSISTEGQEIGDVTRRAIVCAAAEIGKNL